MNRAPEQKPMRDYSAADVRDQLESDCPFGPCIGLCILAFDAVLVQRFLSGVHFHFFTIRFDKTMTHRFRKRT
jgi:hypothetical protein